MKCRAQVLVGPGEFELRDLDVPAPGPGELRMLVHGCGVCGSDKLFAQIGAPGTILGHEVVAEVEATLAVLASGDLDPTQFVTHRIRLDDVPAAIRALGHPTDHVKVVVDYRLSA